MEITGERFEKQYFTVEQANKMIPYLESTFHCVLQVQHWIKRHYRQLERIGHAPETENFSVEKEGLSPTGRFKRATLKGFIDSLRQQLNQVHKKGAIVKGLERGLVDWYAKDGERDIFLCWRLGESKVQYWHPVDAGFEQRRPITALE